MQELSYEQYQGIRLNRTGACGTPVIPGFQVMLIPKDFITGIL